jgi:CheY-like chemotaxis protein
MPRSVDILLVEDNLADIALLKHVWLSEKMLINPFSVRDADEAEEFLMKRNTFMLMPTPDLVLLDWKLPKFEDGERVLKMIRADPNLKTLSVALVSGYMQADESRRALELGATVCLEKPLTLAKMIFLVQQIPDIWLTMVKGPPYPAMVCAAKPQGGAE